MQLKDFDELTKRDYDNAAVTNAIRQVFKERDELLEACKSENLLTKGATMIRVICDECGHIWMAPTVTGATCPECGSNDNYVAETEKECE